MPPASTAPAQPLRASKPSLTVVIPALNEEAAIGATIERCLAASDEIRDQAGLANVCFVVVSDGSTDRTVEIARSFTEIKVVVFPVNRGYGAAIKRGWQEQPAEILGFLDADGTCEPRVFVSLCRELVHSDCDLVLGGRMGPGSKMPALRRLGNVLFALLLGHLSRRSVRDVASGMRVLRRKALARLLPLPDGLHFTPAMSARALMDGELRIVEVEMPYAERVGRSKLKVVRDGLRFLGVIVNAAAFVRVSRLTVPLMLLLLGFAAAVMTTPTVFYVTHARLEEWMFYRFALAGLLGMIASSLLCATIVTEHVSALTLMQYRDFGSRTRGLWRYENLRLLFATALLLALIGVWLNAPGFVDILKTGHTDVHWSRVMAGVFSGLLLVQLAITLGSLWIIRALHERQPYLLGRLES
jgi:glycosyltransferase involved in cell wall biosynthesis